MWHRSCEGKHAIPAETVMKIAIPLCRHRIAPLFEAAETFVLLDSGKSDCSPDIKEFRQTAIGDKCRQLLAEDVAILLCGAISRHWQHQLETLGIEVHAFLAGEVREIAQTFEQEGSAGLIRFAMPGRRRERHGNRRRFRQCRGCDTPSIS
jgi:predicted Fe-Mo cluster-binding NifX family protein